MAHASEPASTIDPAEAAHFGALAADWWDPKGSSAMLHKLNPVRLGYVRAAIDRRFGTDEKVLPPALSRRDHLRPFRLSSTTISSGIPRMSAKLVTKSM